MNTQKNLTIYDIAKETNLSIATISRVINKKGRYSAETEARVLQAMETLGYSPSASAQRLATQQTHTLSLMMPSWNKRQEGDAFTMQFLSGVTVAANELNYDVLLDNRSTFCEDDAELFIQKKKADGLIFTFMSDPYHPFLSQLLKHDFPTVYTGMQLPFDQRGYNIYGGHEIYKRDFLELCYQRNFRHVAMFTSYFHAENLRLVESTMKIVEDFRKEKGLSADEYRLVLYDYYNPDSFQQQLRGLLTQKTPVQAIYLDQLFTCSQAYGIINSIGLKIPEDVSVVATSQYQRGGEEFYPKLSTTYVHAYEMGYNSVYKLVDLIDKKESSIPSHIPYSFIYRESFLPQKDCTPPPSLL